MLKGYYRFPTINNENIVFVSEDDLWSVNISGGLARRLTANLGECSYPVFSPNGKWIAFSGKEEGNTEVYIMPSCGGTAKKITFLGALSHVIGWGRDGNSVLFRSNSRQPFKRIFKVFSVSKDGGLPVSLSYGPASHISFGPEKGIVLGRNTGDPAKWKRYRGGTAGDIWIDASCSEKFSRLIKLNGNLTCPMWIGERIYFISDHEGIGNIYSCLPSGKNLKRHTTYTDYYCRNASTDGKRIVYHCGGDLFVYDTQMNKNFKVGVEYFSPRVQRNRKFVDASKYLENFDLNPKGDSVVISSRGKVFSLPNREGPVIEYGKTGPIRYRLPVWLYDGKRITVVCDETGKESIEIYKKDFSEKIKSFENIDTGRVVDMKPSPKDDFLAISNHRQELMLLNLKTSKLTLIDKSKFGGAFKRLLGIIGFDWSPDGRWLAYGFSSTLRKAEIRLYELASGKSYTITKPILKDVSPSFDPSGKYLYFISYREFNPVYDSMQFELSFPKGAKPCLITLQKNLPSPFIQPPKELEVSEKNKNDKEQNEIPLVIDLDGIQDRVLAFPVTEERYEQIWGIKDDKVLFSYSPVEGMLDLPWFPSEPPAKTILEMYDLREKKKDVLISGITDFKVSMDLKTMVYRAGNKLRVIKAGEKPEASSNVKTPEGVSEKELGKKSGWIDLSRIKLSINPPLEWEQMFKEAWRLQKEQFWTEDMSGINWGKVFEKYSPLLERIASRAELSDLIWEMQGELETSHCYEFMGDYRQPPHYKQGFLGCDFEYDGDNHSYKIKHIVKGDGWQEGKDSPLNSPGVNLKPGDRIVAIGGKRVGENKYLIEELLVNQAGQDIQIRVADVDGKERNIVVRVLSSEFPVRYREWVNSNREFVHRKTKGKAGYLHIPDMGPEGFSEFHRAYLAEIEKPGLIIDVRYNGGGMVSQLLLEKLARKRLAYSVSRWFPPEPYPYDSLPGPMVAITNELAGSDGDIFSHCFKLMKLGPLIGKRTWGGVIGIWPRHPLVDGTITTQPELSFWFKDVGWKVENYGTKPDLEVEITPQDYMKGRDTQLEYAVSEIIRLLSKNSVKIPEFRNKSDLSFSGKGLKK